jgi:hypothetical protein
MIGLLGSVAWSLFRDRGRKIAVWVCAGTVLLFLSAGVFGQTTGRAWNHEPASLFTVLAFLAHLIGIRRQSSRWLIGSGLLLGVAIGLRVTVAPLVAPFGLALALFPSSPCWKPRFFAAFIAGFCVGIFGIICLLAIAPEQTLFGIFGFAKANVAYRLDGGEARTMTLLKKLRYFWKEIVRRELPLIVMALLPLVSLVLASRGSVRRLRFEIRFIIILLPFLLIGCLAPSPLFPQYFYPLIPFVLLAGLFGLASIPAVTSWSRRMLLTEAVIVVASVALGRNAYRELRDLSHLPKWTPLKLHAGAMEFRHLVPPGRVLTLAPIYALEAGLPIYPALSTGSFAWRVAPFVEATKAARLGMVSPATLEASLNAAPPAAILLGFEGPKESALQSYANRHHHRRIRLTDGHDLWISPTAIPYRRDNDELRPLVAQAAQTAGADARVPSASIARTMWGLTSCRMDSTAMRMALRTAKGELPPWAMMHTPLTPRSGMPPYSSEFVFW